MFSKGGRRPPFENMFSGSLFGPIFDTERILTFENLTVFQNHDVCLRNQGATLFSKEDKSVKKAQCEPSPVDAFRVSHQVQFLNSDHSASSYSFCESAYEGRYASYNGLGQGSLLQCARYFLPT
jgi:hypothetical protein